MNAFVVIKHDLEKLKRDILSRSKTESIVCIGLYEYGEPELENLRKAETIYFVVSETSMCSTAYQALLLATIPLIKIEKCRILKLENVKIPAGFPMLQALPEGSPA